MFVLKNFTQTIEFPFILILLFFFVCSNPLSLFSFTYFSILSTFLYDFILNRPIAPIFYSQAFFFFYVSKSYHIRVLHWPFQSLYIPSPSPLQDTPYLVYTLSWLAPSIVLLHRIFSGNSFLLVCVYFIFDFLSTLLSHLHKWLSVNLFRYAILFPLPGLLSFFSLCALWVQQIFSLVQLFI